MDYKLSGTHKNNMIRQLSLQLSLNTCISHTGQEPEESEELVRVSDRVTRTRVYCHLPHQL